MSDVKMAQRRRLTDLYVRGQELALSDGADGEEPIVVWISKISPLEQKDAADRAAAARASTLVIKHYDDDHEDKIPFIDQLEQLTEGSNSRDAFIEFLIAPRLQEKLLSHESELSSEDKWSKDGYFDSLKESWVSSMQAKYDENPKDPEAKKVYTELKKFADEVERRLEADRADFIAEHDLKSDSELRKEVLDRLIDSEGDFAWLSDFRKWQIYYAVREPEEHKRRYFISKEEVDALDPRILRQLLDTFLDLSVDSLEGKD